MSNPKYLTAAARRRTGAPVPPGEPRPAASPEPQARAGDRSRRGNRAADRSCQPASINRLVRRGSTVTDRAGCPGLPDRLPISERRGVPASLISCAPFLNAQQIVTQSVPRGEYVVKWSTKGVADSLFVQVRGYWGAWWMTGLIIRLSRPMEGTTESVIRVQSLSLS
jgi:hypothetical protein